MLSNLHTGVYVRASETQVGGDPGAEMRSIAVTAPVGHTCARRMRDLVPYIFLGIPGPVI